MGRTANLIGDIDLATFITSSVSLEIGGDGTSTSFSYDLADYPLSVPFDKTYPDSVWLASRLIQSSTSGGGDDSSYTVTLSIDKSVLIVTFNKPLQLFEIPVTTGAGLANLDIGMVFLSE
jgi:hypothetical protein